MRGWVLLVALAGGCTGRHTEFAGTVEHDMVVHAVVQSNQVDQFVVGKRVVIRVSTFPDETFIGMVDRISSPSDGRAEVCIAFVSGITELRTGADATVLVSD